MNPPQPRLFGKLEGVVFFLVSAAFVTIYITQPVLPVIREQFGVGETAASLTISAVILGIALANIPFGILADNRGIRPIILIGGGVVASCGIACALPLPFEALIGFRFVQGLFIPALTTCLAAYLSRRLPAERLNVVMGSYVSATVAGGLGGRLLGGMIHPGLHWRWSFVFAGLLVSIAVAVGLRWLPANDPASGESPETALGFRDMWARREIRSQFLVAFSGFFVFSSVFNYLPFYLAGPAFEAPTRLITLMYLSYLIGIVAGPLAGRLANRFGNGPTMAGGALVFAAAMLVSLIPSLFAIPVSLTGVCAGFFTVHAAAAGWLNRQLDSSRGRANSLYILCYYAGGTVGITASGMAYERWNWTGVVGLGLLMLTVPFGVGIRESLGRMRVRL